MNSFKPCMCASRFLCAGVMCFFVVSEDRSFAHAAGEAVPARGTQISSETTVPQPFDRVRDVVLSSKVVPQAVVYIVKPGDTLGKIAKSFSTTIELIRISNGLAGDIVRAGQSLRIWAKPFTIIVSKKANVLRVMCGTEIIKTYSVSTGAGNMTPVGTFTVTTRYEDPVWFRKGVPVPPESSENALGTRWLGFDKPKYGIHGTIFPELIGKQASHGCVRMLNKDVEELYLFIPVGTRVTIQDGPFGSPAKSGSKKRSGKNRKDSE